MIDLFCDPCLDILPNIKDVSIDLILCDPPYAVTVADFDTQIPIDEMFEQLNRIIKPKCPIVLCCQQPFTTDLINGNRDRFKYAIVWNKLETTGFLTSKIRHMQQHEDILIFGDAGTTYNPQMVKRDKSRKYTPGDLKLTSSLYGLPTNARARTTTYTHKFPTTIINQTSTARAFRRHPNEKPLALMENLIKTFSNVGDTVLDFTMGSGTTGVSAIQCGRSFIGIEKDLDFFNIAESRIMQAERTEDSVNDMLVF